MSDQSQAKILEDFIKNACDVSMDAIHVAHGKDVQIQILNKNPKEFFGLVHDTPFSDLPMDIRKHSIKKVKGYYQFDAVDSNTGSDWRFRIRFCKSPLMEKIMGKLAPSREEASGSELC